MRRLALLFALSLAPAAALGAQDEAAPPSAEHAGHAGMDAPPAGADLTGEWKQLQGHWTMVQSLSASEKASHLEMHRSMVDDLMSRLATGDPEAKPREGEGPVVGDRLENADRAPVPGDRAAPLEDEAMAADEEPRAGERIDEERTERAAAAGAGLADLQEHWDVVEGLEDLAQLEEHLGMHMSMLEDFLGRGPTDDPAAGDEQEGTGGPRRKPSPERGAGAAEAG